MTTEMPRVLIEDWLPIETLGAESKRERGASSALPPLYFLHIWWARRPLTVSRAAVLASALPRWSPEWPEDLLEQFPNEADYHKWFLELNGIFGDPVSARRLLDRAKQQGHSIPNPYTHSRAFTVNPSTDYLATMGDLVEHTWATRELSMLDPFAGGGSIPFEALRYGFTSIANDLNPVATVILKATLDYPARFGPSFADDIRKWGKSWYELVKPKLQPYFAPLPLDAEGAAYLWARTVACPTTGKPVPLSPNWWLRKGSKPVAVRLIAEDGEDLPHFVIVEGDEAITANPDEGTVSRGVGRSPWTGETVSGGYIKAEAQAGRMGQMLYTIAIKRPRKGFIFRAPTDADQFIARQAEVALSNNLPRWEANGLVPHESRQAGRADWAAEIYGLNTWADAFAPRQLLAMCTIVDALADIRRELYSSAEKDYADALITYLCLAFDKAVSYNSTQTTWDSTRRKIASAFQRHDFAFKWSFGEFDAAHNLLPWVVDQVISAYTGMAKLAQPASLPLWQQQATSPPVDRLCITRGSASDLDTISDDSVQLICVDPPYYDNVQYAELSDYFYIWLKRTIGDIHPDWFQTELVNKDDETVATPARFAAFGSKRRVLAEQDYERKMAAAFREMHRVLHPHGVLTVMFTHKRVEAWDTLATALIGAGFTIKASWPVHTESEHSLHQAKKNAAASTILLVCRKRPPSSDDGAVWWDDLQGQVRRVAREKAQEYATQGIGGVDLYISTFGPTLSVISEQWPVLTSEIDPKTGQPRPLRPETALDLAREEVIRLRREGLLAGKAIEFDPVTDWYLMAWDAFKAEQFPFDEARKLAIALGLELDHLRRAKKMIAKKGKYVVLQQPAQRRKRGMVDPDATVFEHWIDALHTAMLIYDEDGAGACDVFLMNRGLKRDTTFRAGLQALINAIPRTKIKGKFARPEADVLDRMRLAFYADELTVPPEDEPELQAVQERLL